MTEICYTIRGSGCVFIISSFRGARGGARQKRVAQTSGWVEPEEERPTIRAWMRVQTPPLFLRKRLTDLARYDIVILSIRHVPVGGRVDPGSMPGCHLIDSHFHPFGESCE
nr:MAG TPA: hypothetical protein [Caudoviricetes sp.]